MESGLPKMSINLLFSVNWWTWLRITRIQCLLEGILTSLGTKKKKIIRFDTHWPFLFNAVIDSLDLREASMSGRQFTWVNNRSVPTYEKLDRVLTDTEWELTFPMVTVRALERIEALSDHAPIILDSNSTNPASRCPFKFQLGWLLRERFVDMFGRGLLLVVHLFRDGTLK